MLLARFQVHPAAAHFYKPAVLPQIVERGCSVVLAIDAAWIRVERGCGYRRAVRDDTRPLPRARVAAVQVAGCPRERAAVDGERRVRLTGSDVVPAAGGLLVAVHDRRVANMIVRTSADEVVGCADDGVGEDERRCVIRDAIAEEVHALVCRSPRTHEHLLAAPEVPADVEVEFVM